MHTLPLLLCPSHFVNDQGIKSQAQDQGQNLQDQGFTFCVYTCLPVLNSSLSGKFKYTV